MNEHETERIADALNRLRPDWPIKQLRTLLGDDQLRDRPRRDVAVALVWVACETDSQSPYRVLKPGPWWKACGVDGTVTSRREPYDPTCCTTCALPQARCRQLWTGDHEFVAAHRNAERAPADVSDHMAEMRRATAEAAAQAAAAQQARDAAQADRERRRDAERDARHEAVNEMEETG